MHFADCSNFVTCTHLFFLENYPALQLTTLLFGQICDDCLGITATLRPQLQHSIEVSTNFILTFRALKCTNRAMA
jgi:hypothetical protein